MWDDKQPSDLSPVHTPPDGRPSGILDNLNTSGRL